MLTHLGWNQLSQLKLAQWRSLNGEVGRRHVATGARHGEAGLESAGAGGVAGFTGDETADMEEWEERRGRVQR